LVNIPGAPRFHFREVTPKDFYFAQILRSSDRSLLELVERLLLNEEVLDHATYKQTETALRWVADNILVGKILTVENWLEVAYHLCKQRWDSSVDWLENQPMSKINAMISIVEKHADRQEKEMKKSSRRR
jgi:nanoRNase/pAp phosphatase (c-di-AMP/oligoRNAs hydrolase)